MRVLWLSPTFNHYKARFLNELAADGSIELTVLTGLGRYDMGDTPIDGVWHFKHLNSNAMKKDFAKSLEVRGLISEVIHDIDWIMIPAEKKNFPLLQCCWKKAKKLPVRLFSYNHAVFKSNILPAMIDLFLTKMFFKKLDRVIFYTEEAKEWAISKKIITEGRAYHANNTIVTSEIRKIYNFRPPDCSNPTILFIGRLIPSKRIDIFLHYLERLRDSIPEIQGEIIGDGPDSNAVVDFVSRNNYVKWHGAISDEKMIAQIMKRSCIIFLPGHSGLSINHAFAYGRPYVTIRNKNHAPEITYLENDKNGLILDGDEALDIEQIALLLQSHEMLNNFSTSAFEKSKELTTAKWVQQIIQSLKVE